MNQEVLDKIKVATFPDTPEGRVLADCQKIIGDISQGYTKPDNISTTKVDLTDKVKEADLTVKQFEDVFGSVKLSEADVVDYVANQCAAAATAPKPANDAQKKKVITLMRMRKRLQDQRLRLK